MSGSLAVGPNGVLSGLGNEPDGDGVRKYERGIVEKLVGGTLHRRVHHRPAGLARAHVGNSL